MQHPILIDFFPWPNLRERFVRGFGCIEAHKFSILLLLHFKFQWPFSFDDTFVYDALGDTYQANPLFQLYYQDLNCWTMESSFFHEYPELREDILSHPSGTAFKPVERAPQD